MDTTDDRVLLWSICAVEWQDAQDEIKLSADPLSRPFHPQLGLLPPRPLLIFSATGLIQDSLTRSPASYAAWFSFSSFPHIRPTGVRRFPRIGILEVTVVHKSTKDPSIFGAFVAYCKIYLEQAECRIVIIPRRWIGRCVERISLSRRNHSLEPRRTRHGWNLLIRRVTEKDLEYAGPDRKLDAMRPVWFVGICPNLTENGCPRGVVVSTCPGLQKSSLGTRGFKRWGRTFISKSVDWFTAMISPMHSWCMIPVADRIALNSKAIVHVSLPAIFLDHIAVTDGISAKVNGKPRCIRGWVRRPYRRRGIREWGQRRSGSRRSGCISGIIVRKHKRGTTPASRESIHGRFVELGYRRIILTRSTDLNLLSSE